MDRAIIHMKITNSQRILLETIHTHDGQWNWYKLGRACLGLLDSPADFVLEPLFEAGYVEEHSIENEPLPRLQLTDLGKQALQAVVSQRV